MQSIIDLFVTYKVEILTGLFLLSEILSLFPGIKANGVFQLIYGWIKKAKDAVSPPPAA